MGQSGGLAGRAAGETPEALLGTVVVVVGGGFVDFCIMFPASEVTEGAEWSGCSKRGG